jgi:hypothetical protein
MTIWMLTILLLASLAGMGLRQGIVRVTFSTVGIVLGAILAVPVGRLIRPAAAAVGISHATVLWMLPPVIVFVVVVVGFKIAALAVDHKVEVFFKYKAGDLRSALWNRLNHRLGMCLGVVNGALYLILLSFVIYIFSYWTVQLAAPTGNPKLLRLMNQLGRDLQSTGMARAARAIDRMPAYYYETADLAGVLYHTPLLEARMYRYPAFLGLAEAPAFQEILNDKTFTELWQKQASIVELFNYRSIQAILKNKDLLKTLWATTKPNLQDLRTYLETGKSPVYDSMRIVGRWDFNVNGTMALLRKARPNISSSEMSRVKKLIAQNYAAVTLIAMTDQRVFIKNYPSVKVVAGAAPTTELKTVEGEWKETDGNYILNYTLEGKAEEATVNIESTRLSVTGQGLGLAFLRQD